MHQQRWRVFWIRNEYTLDYQITQDFASTFSQFKQTLKLALIQKAYNHLEHANIFMHNALGIRYVFMFLCLYSLPSQTMMRIKVSTYICNMTTRSKAVSISFDFKITFYAPRWTNARYITMINIIHLIQTPILITQDSA